VTADPLLHALRLHWALGHKGQDWQACRERVCVEARLATLRREK
jgi:hypothetical protein